MLSPSQRFRALRIDKNLTQDELAKKLGCSKHSIYRYENNQSQMDTYTLIKTAHFFEVTADYLLGISNQKKSEGDVDNDQYATFYDENYFWIFDDETGFGGDTRWVDFTEDGKEIRTLCPIIPERALKFHIEQHGFPPVIINKPKDVATFLKSGGNAIIRESICEEYLPRFLKPYITETNFPKLRAK